MGNLIGKGGVIMPIVINKPDVELERRYRVSEICKVLGIHRDTLRKYEANLKIQRIGTRPIYEGIEIIRYWKKVNGYSL